MNCPTCGQANPDGSQFCRSCGAALSLPPATPVTPTADTGWPCAACGHDNRSGARFCASCGAPAASSAPITTSPEAAVPPVMPSAPAAASLPPTSANADATAAPTCPHCHAPRPLGGRFCKACGQPFDEATAMPLSTLMPAPPMTPPMAAANHTFVPTQTTTSPASDADATVVVPPSPAPASHPGPAAPAAKPAATPAAGGGKSAIVLVLGGAALLAAIGGLASWKLHQRSTAADQAMTPAPSSSSPSAEAPPAPASMASPTGATPTEATAAATAPATPTAPALAATASPAAVIPVLANTPPAAPATSAPTAITVAPPATPPAADQASAPAPEPAPIIEPQPSRPLPTRHVRAPTAPAEPSRNDIALKLVREGEAAFSQQNYSVAIADAKAALAVAPDNARASHLLQEAQQAQQNAMNSISIQ